MKAIKRAALGEVLSASAEFPAVMVTGARQVGKTTLLKEAAESGRRFVSLDILTVRDLARRDPRAFLLANPPPVIIDEIQYAPQLLPYIKAMIDESPGGSSRRSRCFRKTRSRELSMSLRGCTVDSSRLSCLDAGRGEEKTRIPPFRT